VTRCITANVLQTNKVDAQCDKVVTELANNDSRRKSSICSYRTFV